MLAFEYPFPSFMTMSVSYTAFSVVFVNFVDVPCLAIICNFMIIFGSQAPQVSLLKSSLQRTTMYSNWGNEKSPIWLSLECGQDLFPSWGHTSGSLRKEASSGIACSTLCTLLGRGRTPQQVKLQALLLIQQERKKKKKQKMLEK